MDALPDELICWVAGFLQAQGKSRLMRVSKRFEKLITPTLWSFIELHPEGRHSKRELGHPVSEISEQERPYFHFDDDPNDRVSEEFFKTLNRVASKDQGRLGLIASRVRRLCCEVSPQWIDLDDDGRVLLSIWDFFPYFINLEYLDLRGDWDGRPLMFSTPNAPPLRQLRYIYLFGYVPRGFAAWILRAGDTLERVEFGMLDRPISSTLCADGGPNRPLPEENLLLEDSDYDSSNEGSDNGSLDGEWVSPRPLGGFLPNDQTEVHNEKALHLPVLKNLYLSQPSRSEAEEYDFRSYNWSTRAEIACLADWRNLLLATNSSLEVLVLEQRPVAESIEMDGFGCTEWVLREKQGTGSQSLLNMVMECLAIEGSFPHLRKVYLWGIAVGTEEGASISQVARDTTPGSKLMYYLQERGIACEARLGIWTLFDASEGALCWGEHYASDDDGGLSHRTLLATTDPDVVSNSQINLSGTVMPAMRQGGTQRGTRTPR